MFKEKLNDTDNDADNDTDNDTDSRLNQIVQLLRKNNKFTTKQLSDFCYVSQITIKRDIEKLKKQKKLKRIGSEKGGHWEIIENK